MRAKFINENLDKNDINTLQFFHKKETLPPFNIGDKVRLKDDLTGLLPLHKLNTKELKQIHKDLERYLGKGVHIVSKVEPGTPEAGGWFIYVDGIDEGYHGNIFELVQ
jgi:hypothetical protein